MSIAISAAMVKDLRERTGAGMMECKNALVDAQGDLEEAVTVLRKRGVAKVAKRGDKVASEGVAVISSSPDHKVAIMIEINSETDFVARDESFNAFAQFVAKESLLAKATDFATLPAIEEARQVLAHKLGENIQLRRAVILESSGCVATYNHGSRIGVLVALDKDDHALGQDIAMHIAASNPQAIDESGIDPMLIEKEREIFKAQAEQSGKSGEIIDKMVDGRIAKFKKEICLLDQPFVRNPDQTVAALLKAAGAKVTAFARYEVGEGIEKEIVDFAKEVHAQIKGE